MFLMLEKLLNCTDLPGLPALWILGAVQNCGVVRFSILSSLAIFYFSVLSLWTRLMIWGASFLCVTKLSVCCFDIIFYILNGYCTVFIYIFYNYIVGFCELIHEVPFVGCYVSVSFYCISFFQCFFFRCQIYESFYCVSKLSSTTGRTGRRPVKSTFHCSVSTKFQSHHQLQDARDIGQCVLQLMMTLKILLFCVIFVSQFLLEGVWKCLLRFPFYSFFILYMYVSSEWVNMNYLSCVLYPSNHKKIQESIL